MATFTNATGVTFPGNIFTASQTVNVTGLSGTVGTVSITFTGLTHNLSDDLEFLLVAPDGTTNLLFWSDVGGNDPFSNISVTITDSGATVLADSGSVPVSGTTYRPANYPGSFGEAPETGATFGLGALSINHATGTGSATFASIFSGYANPNGTWTLYLRDDANGDGGSLVSWSLNITGGSVSVIGDKVFEDLDGNGVQDAGEQGVDGVTVQLLNGVTVVDTTTTAGGGLYNFTNVADGTYSIKFITAVGTNYAFTTQDQGGNDALDSDVNASGQTATFAVAGSNITNIDAGLRGTHIVSQVFGDLDRDGVQDAGETGVDGVTVRLLNSSNVTIATAVTANGGMYDFSNVAAGTYSLEYVAPAGFAFSPKDAGVNDALDSDANASNPNIGRTDQFAVALGQTVTNVDAGVYATAGFGTYTFTNTTGVNFPVASANQTVQTLTLGGIGGPIASIRVFINGLTHDNIDDLDFWLVGPNGTSNLLFLSDVGGNVASGPVNLIIADAGASLLPSGSALSSGTFRPTDYTEAVEGAETAGSFGAGGTLVHAAPIGAGTFASAFTGLNPNGAWTLYARDDSSGDAGAFTSWGIEVTTASVSVIGDKVFEDLDGDGIQDAGEQGVNGITVQLLSGVTIVDTTTTASGGLYSFTGVFDGTYSVNFVIPGGSNYIFTSQDQGGNDALDSDANLSGQTATFAVAGSNITNVDAGLRGTHVGNRVFGDLDQDGVQDAGEAGLDGVTVRLLNSSNVTVATTITANGGFYDFANVTPGTYSVDVDLPTQFSFSPRDAGGDDALDSDVDTTTGQSAQFAVVLGQTVSNVDAGVYATNGVGTFLFTNTAGAAFPTATPAVFAQTFSIGGVDGVISQIRIHISGLSHNSPDDLDFLLVGPDGTHNLLFWSDAGGNAPGGPFNIVIDDVGASGLPDATALSSIVYRPTDHTTGPEGLETAASFGASGFTINRATSAGSASLLPAFENLSPNGVWTLYLRDDAPGDGGSLTSWSLEITTVILNEPPTVNATSGSGAEDGARIAITLSGTDPDAGDAIDSFTIATLSASGQLFTAASGGTLLTAGATVPAVGDAATVYFQPNANFNGPTSFTYTAFDGDESGAPATASITVSAVNDEPSGANTIVTFLEDGAHTFTAANFGFTDVADGDDLLDVIVDTLPTVGVLALNGVAVIAGNAISAADINGGLLTYTPPANVNGDFTFTFRVRDDGGTLGGGINTDQTANTLTLDVTSVNDAPVVIGDAQATLPAIDEDAVNPPGATVFSLFFSDYSDATDNQFANPGGSSPGAFSGIAVIANGSSAATGQWQYLDGGLWFDIGPRTPGTAFLIGEGVSLRFLPATDFSGAAPTLTAHLIDNSLPFGIDFQNANLSGPGATGDTTAYSTATVTLNQNVTPVEDPPVNTVPGGYAPTEDTAFSLTGLSVSDDTPGVVLTVTLSVTQGTLSSPDATGLGVTGSGTDTLVLTGTAAAVNAALAAANNIVYQAGGDYNGSDTLTILTEDDGATGSVLSDTDTVAITVGPQNDPVTGDAPASVEIDEDSTNTPIAGLSISDVDAFLAPAGLYQVILSAAEGTLSLGDLTGVTFVVGNGTDDPAMTFRGGTLAALNAVLATASYTPTAGFSGPTTITLEVIDDLLGVVATGSGPGTSDTDVINVEVLNLNSAPVNTLPIVPAAATEDASSFIAGLSIADSDAGPTAVLTTTLSVGRGVLNVVDTTGVGVTGNGTASVVISGTIAQINAALAAANNIRYTPNADVFGDDQLTMVTDDGGATGLGGPKSDTDVLTIQVAGTPDAPTLTDLGPPATFTEGEAAVIIDPDALLADVDLDQLAGDNGDYGGTTLTIQRTGGANAQDVFAITNGFQFFGGQILDLEGEPIGTVTNTGGVLTLTFVSSPTLVTSATVNAVLHAITYENPSEAPPASVGLTYTFDDGSGAPGGVINATTSVTIVQVNDAPTLTGVGPGVATNEQQPVVIDANATVFDAELAAANSYIGSTLTVQRQGAANVEDTYDFNFLSGNFTTTSSTIESSDGRVLASYTVVGGVLTISFTGAQGPVTQATVNEVLQSLRYTNSSNSPPASVVLDLTFSDGNTGGQGTGGALTATASQTITIAEINDAPSGTDGAVSLIEDTTYTVTAANFGFTDVDGDAFTGVLVTSFTLLGGSLTLNGAPIMAGQFITIADINAGLLRYTPPADTFGPSLASLGFQVQDDGGTANGGINQDPTSNILTFNVTPEATPPAGTDSTRTIDEDQAYALRRADFGFTDPGPGLPNAFASVIITSLPGAGVLRLNGVAVTAGQEVSVADLNAGRLVYTPPAETSGTGLASFSFQVRDAGPAGLNLDLTPNTLTFNVANVNDAPTHERPLFVVTGEDTPVTILGISVADVDAGPNAILTTTLSVAQGTLSLGEPGAASITLTGTLAQINAALAGGVVYTPAAGDTGQVQLTISTNDGGATGGPPQTGVASVLIEIGAVNDAPIVTLAGGPIEIDGGDPVKVNPGLTVLDPDSPRLASAIVAITDGFVAGEDVLAFTASAATGDIAASYNAATGVLTLTSLATATVAQWQAALRAVTYDSTAANPTGDDRTVTFTVSDGQATSAPVSQILDLDGLATLDLLKLAFEAILRIDPDAAGLNPPTAAEAAQLAGLAGRIDGGTLTLEDAYQTIAGFADDTTSVATLAYQFFTGLTPTQAGYDFLVAGPANPNDLNDPYYAPFNLVNRYINFAVNLGAAGEGKAAFQAEYGALTLAEAMAKAYTEILGFAPAAGKIAQILAADVGAGLTRADYLAYYGGDGLNGLGTKAAAVGFLLSVAVIEDLGPYAQANDNFLADLADGDASFHIDLIDIYLDPASPIGLVGMAAGVEHDVAAM